jgi:hypothetical protein
MHNPEKFDIKVERSRRNIVKIGAILTSAIVAALVTTRSRAAAGQGGNNQGGNNQGGNCLLRGTKIRTANGDRKVEELMIGDLLPTIFGGMRPIQWIGRYPFKKSDSSKPWVKGGVACSYRSLGSRSECSAG